MIYLIIGGSGSGKSAYAEKLLLGLSGKKFYIATMQVFDEEGQKKVDRHRRLREDKGFQTIECPQNVGLISNFQNCPVCGENKNALLECMSNLVANEMFCKSEMVEQNQVVDKIAADIRILEKKLDNLVIVTNNVFEDGVQYDESTMEYLKALGHINQLIAARASVVVEVVAGIPVEIKNETGKAPGGEKL